MRKSLYTYYKERLIEIGGNNKCLYLKSISKKSAYDLGKLLEGRDGKIAEFYDFLFSGKSFPLSILSKDEKKEILQNLKANGEYDKKDGGLDDEKIMEKETSAVRELGREIDEIERETGRYELYVGYPFVFGSLPQGPKRIPVKAPLLLFPVRINVDAEGTVELIPDGSLKIQINKALVFAYAQAKKISVDELSLEFDDLSGMKSARAVVDYLCKNHIRFDYPGGKNIFGFKKFREPDERTPLGVRHAAVLGRFSLSNSIYQDYGVLEEKRLTNDAIVELLTPKAVKKKAKKHTVQKEENHFAVRMLDYAQTEVVKAAAGSPNMVIYGPPGTGKSQTIVNIISDAIVKGKRVLVVSQKKAALDVVYNRLGPLNEKAMYLSDENKQKQLFYSRCQEAHQKDMIESLIDVEGLEKRYSELENRVRAEVSELEKIHATLHDVRPFGLSLSEMYESSYILSKSSFEYAIYQNLIKDVKIMKMNYKELSDAVFDIRAKNLGKLYYTFMEEREKNPVIDHLKSGVDLNTLSEVKGQIEEISKSKKGLFNTAKYPYYRQVLAYYYEIQDEKNFNQVVKLTAKVENPGKLFTGKEKAAIAEEILKTDDAISQFTEEFDCLHRVLTPDGYLAVIDNILRGNTSYIKFVKEALDNYISLRDVNLLFESLDDGKLCLLNFAYTTSKNYQNYKDILDKILLIRIYHELTVYEEKCKGELSRTVDFANITSRIETFKKQQLEIAMQICTGKNSRAYDTLYNSSKDNKDYLYQISKKKNYWPIRKTMEIYSEYILSLFPCWLLSPENVSTFLPLVKNLFDLVVFDEASQVFIEATVPTIFRGKNIVVAGDDKQLRPSATFLKRYLGGNPEEQDDLSMQAALEVDSLLDLAVSRYESANLNYHYRSKYSELIAFSNAAFYGAGLQIAPNTVSGVKPYPIERIKVDGAFIDRKNVTEANKVAETLQKILDTRKDGETVGIIAFSAEQQSAIADAIDDLAKKSPEFRQKLAKEQHRIENGEDVSLFIKNLENVQGDERDIIIFSIGYAKNAQGKVYTNFGSLSTEGGENRLNVAITRARTKIYVVTSIEPEELKVDTAKNQGPKLLREYLSYVRAVSDGDKESALAVLRGLCPTENSASMTTLVTPAEEVLKEKLEKLGLTVKLHLGNRKNRITLAVLDPETNRYLVGVILDRDATLSSEHLLERDLYQPMFLESRGWTVLRVFSRDIWLSPNKVARNVYNLFNKVKAKMQ